MLGGIASNLASLMQFRRRFVCVCRAAERRRTSEKALADCCGPVESVTEMLAKKRPRT